MIDALIKRVRTGPKTEVRVENDRGMIRVREWFLANDGSLRPGKAGLDIRAEAVARVAAALVETVGCAK